MAITDLDLVPGRACGDCTACCVVMAIDQPDIRKAAGVACRHCRGGCAIYPTRPPVCRDFHCGWRQLPILDEPWRPDLSGVFVEIEQRDGETVLSLVLIGNPLKTVRQDWFQDFIATGIKGGVTLDLGVLGPPGHQGASLPLNTRQMLAACGKRAALKAELEHELKRLRAYRCEPRHFRHNGPDFG